jgi:hypothetical protein
MASVVLGAGGVAWELARFGSTSDASAERLVAEVTARLATSASVLSTYCTLNSAGTYYLYCNYNGVYYRPITTRMRRTDIYSCGDGVCQFTERCGSGTSYNSCYADCGACPP